MMKQKLISIIIPTYNRAHLLCETIKSIQDQTYTEWECIIVDDGSTDDTENVISDFIEGDSRITYYKKPPHIPKGPSAARNYGFLKSSGSFINWFDSDDLMHPKKLETDLKHIHSGDYDFTISQSSFFKVNGAPKKRYWNKTIWSEDPINDFICKKIGWGINSPLWLKKSLESYNLIFDEHLMTADDFKYHIQAMQSGLKPIVIDAELVRIREHGNRLNNYPDKASNKLKTYVYLLQHHKILGLNENTLSYLNWHYIKFYSWLLKSKNIKSGTKFLIECYMLNFMARTKFKVFKLWCIGLAYFVFGSGYKLLKH